MECTQNDETLEWSDTDDGTAWVSWKNKATCHSPNDPDSPPKPDDPVSAPRKGGSGVGWFFFL